MLEPTVSPRPSVVALAASLVFLAACQREEAAPAPPPAPAVSAPPVVAIGPAPVLDRAGLLQAMDVAASAYAAGKDPGGATLAIFPASSFASSSGLFFASFASRMAMFVVKCPKFSFSGTVTGASAPIAFFISSSISCFM